MNWVKALPRDELPEGTQHLVKVNEHDILLINHKGEIHAVDSRCPHMGGPLAQGDITEEGAIICPRHHSVFDLHTGAVKDWAPWPPGVGRVLGMISRERNLQVFPIKVEGGSIWVDLEEVI